MNANINNDAQAAPFSDWALEQYLLGESPADEFAAINAREPADVGLKERLASLRRSDAEILEAYPPARMARRVGAVYAERTARAKKRRAERVPLFAVPVIVCATLLVLLPVSRRTVESVGVPAATNYEDRVKGVGLKAPAIEVWRKEGDSARKLAPLSAAMPGDIVQLRYAVPEFCYGALVSVDSRGHLTVHLSGESGSAAPLAPGRFVPLDMSFKLDDAPLFEAFYLITAPKTFDVDSVARPLIKANHPVDRWDGLSQTKLTAFTLRKPREGAEN